MLCLQKHIRALYHIATNEISGELGCKHDIYTCKNNMLSSHRKRSPLLWPCYRSNLISG